MTQIIDTLLLLALPASGKSEVRRYLAHLSPETCQNDFHLGPTVQLDDFPYVHLMRRIDDELAACGAPRLYFHSPERPFQDGRDWGTLIELVNEDYRDLVGRRIVTVNSAAEHLIARLERAAAHVDIPPRLGRLAPALRERIAGALEPEARAQLDEKQANYPPSLAGRTLVIEFARGGHDGAALPLAPPFGYRHSLSLLDPAILERAAILYIWVTPEESRRKNLARTDPNDPGSILHHGVPLEVMLHDYGTDDMTWLEAHGERPGTVAVTARGDGRTYHLPIGRFDNRVDRTSFLRAPTDQWPADAVSAIHAGLKDALERIATAS